MSGGIFNTAYGFALVVVASYGAVMGAQWYSAEKSIASARLLLARGGADETPPGEEDE